MISLFGKEMAMKIRDPEKVELTEAQIEELTQHINDNNLTEQEKRILRKILNFSLWLEFRLKEAKLTIGRLRRLFGFKTEKQQRREENNKSNQDDDDDNDNNDDDDTGSGDPACDRASSQKSKKRQNGGRLGYDKYCGLPEVLVPHETLSVGSQCECGGRLYAYEPGGFIQLIGQPPVGGHRYKLERLRCSSCTKIYEAQLPETITAAGKYTPSLLATLGIHRYHLGLPHKRLEKYQAQQGVPLPDSTQWRCVEQLAGHLLPIYQCLLTHAAQQRLMQTDDTHMKILSYIAENKCKDYKGRRGMNTTTIVTPTDKGKIYLYITSRLHAGNNTDKLLDRRDEDLPNIIQMSDGLNHNIPKKHACTHANCLTHGRRNFMDCQSQAKQLCQTLLNWIGRLYHYDDCAKEMGFTGSARRYYHRHHSKPVLHRIHRCLIKLEAQKAFEPSSSMGKAIRYILKRWDAVTLFLHEDDVPLDNSESERSLKDAIVHRKNSLFYKTPYGAMVGDIMMSVMTTAHRCGIALFPYLLAVQKYTRDVVKNPKQWLPWCYQATIAQLETCGNSPPINAN